MERLRTGHEHPAQLSAFAAKLRPWSLMILLVWLLAQFPVGHFFNDFPKGVPVADVGQAQGTAPTIVRHVRKVEDPYR